MALLQSTIPPAPTRGTQCHTPVTTAARCASLPTTYRSCENVGKRRCKKQPYVGQTPLCPIAWFSSLPELIAGLHLHKYLCCACMRTLQCPTLEYLRLAGRSVCRCLRRWHPTVQHTTSPPLMALLQPSMATTPCRTPAMTEARCGYSSCRLTAAGSSRDHACFASWGPGPSQTLASACPHRALVHSAYQHAAARAAFGP